VRKSSGISFEEANMMLKVSGKSVTRNVPRPSSYFIFYFQSASGSRSRVCFQFHDTAVLGYLRKNSLSLLEPTPHSALWSFRRVEIANCFVYALVSRIWPTSMTGAISQLVLSHLRISTSGENAFDDRSSTGTAHVAFSIITRRCMIVVSGFADELYF